MAFGAPDDEERDIRLALGRISSTLTEHDLAVVRELLPEHPSLRRLLIAHMDLVRALALVANGLAPSGVVDQAADAVREVLGSYVADSHMTVSERAHADQVLAALRDQDADEVRRLTRSKD